MSVVVPAAQARVDPSRVVRQHEDRHGPVRPVFIGGCPRSGTTLLGAMLGVGPRLLTVPEAWFKMRLLAHVDAAGLVDTRTALDGLRRDDRFALWRVPLPSDDGVPRMVPARDLLTWLVLRFGARSDKPTPAVWVDHSPSNVRHALTLAQVFPEARFIHLVRDGRAVAASVLPLDWGPNRASEAASWWGTHVAMGLAAERRLGSERVRLVRFEDLVARPADVLEDVCDWLDVPFDARMLDRRDYHVSAYTVTQHDRVPQAPDPARIDAWRTDLAPRQVEDFEYVTWELSAYLGYELVHGARARIAPRHVRLGEFVEDVARRGVLDRVRRRRSARQPYR